MSRLCHDPRVAVAVLHQMMMPYQLNGRLFVMHPHRPISAWTHGDRVTGVVVRGLESGRDSLIEAPFFIDATPYGDLLDLAGVEHVLGAESRSRDRRAACGRTGGSARPAGDHGLLRDGTPPRGGPHHRQAPAVRALARVPPAGLARAAC